MTETGTFLHVKGNSEIVFSQLFAVCFLLTLGKCYIFKGECQLEQCGLSLLLLPGASAISCVVKLDEEMGK